MTEKEEKKKEMELDQANLLAAQWELGAIKLTRHGEIYATEAERKRLIELEEIVIPELKRKFEDSANARQAATET